MLKKELKLYRRSSWQIPPPPIEIKRLASVTQVPPCHAGPLPAQALPYPPPPARGSLKAPVSRPGRPRASWRRRGGRPALRAGGERARHPREGGPGSARPARPPPLGSGPSLRILPASLPESPPRRRKYSGCLLPGERTHRFRKLLLVPGWSRRTTDPKFKQPAPGAGRHSAPHPQSPPGAPAPAASRPRRPASPSAPPLTLRSQSPRSPLPLAGTRGSCCPPLGHLGCHRGTSLAHARGPRSRHERAEPHAEHEREQQPGPRVHGERWQGRQRLGRDSTLRPVGGTPGRRRLRAPGAGAGAGAGAVGAGPEPGRAPPKFSPATRTRDSERRAAEGVARSSCRACGGGAGRRGRQ